MHSPEEFSIWETAESVFISLHQERNKHADSKQPPTRISELVCARAPDFTEHVKRVNNTKINRNS